MHIFHCFSLAKLDFVQGVFKKTLQIAGAAVERPRLGEYISTVSWAAPLSLGCHEIGQNALELTTNTPITEGYV